MLSSLSARISRREPPATESGEGRAASACRQGGGLVRVRKLRPSQPLHTYLGQLPPLPGANENDVLVAECSTYHIII